MVMGNVKRSLSILLAIAMIITMMPQAAMPVYAGELGANGDVNEIPKADDLVDLSSSDEDTPGGETSNEDGNQPEVTDPEDTNTPDETPVNPAPGAGSDGLGIGDEPGIGNEPGIEEETGNDSGIMSVNDVEPFAGEGETTYTISGLTNGTGYTVKDGNHSETPIETSWDPSDGDYVFTVDLNNEYKNLTVGAAIDAETVALDEVAPAGETTYYKYTITSSAVAGIGSGEELTINISISVEKKADVVLTIDKVPDEEIGTVQYITAENAKKGKRGIMGCMI